MERTGRIMEVKARLRLRLWRAKGVINIKLFPFSQKAAFSAIAAGISWFLYGYFFLIARDPMMSSLFLLLSGLLAVDVFVGWYMKLKEADEGWALVVLLLGVVGALGTAIHGGYDLANVINPPANPNLDLPNQVDPRGLLAFGLTGIAILKGSYLAYAKGKFSQNFNMLGMLSGLLLIVIYLARLTVLDPSNPLLKYPVLLEGFIVNPLWYLWLGYMWWQKARA